MHKKRFYFFSVTILNLKVKYRSFLSKNMTHKFINSKSYRNRKLSVNVQHYVVLAATFCFAYLNLNLN